MGEMSPTYTAWQENTKQYWLLSVLSRMHPAERPNTMVMFLYKWTTAL